MLEVMELDEVVGINIDASSFGVYWRDVDVACGPYEEYTANYFPVFYTFVQQRFGRCSGVKIVLGYSQNAAI